jgi:hypothetical protein
LCRKVSFQEDETDVPNHPTGDPFLIVNKCKFF